MSTDTTTTRKPGRPPINLNWPNGEFTVEQLSSTGLSKVTLYQKVNAALRDNVITVIGKERNKQGRPRTLYKKSACSEDTIVSSEVEQVAVPA